MSKTFEMSNVPTVTQDKIGMRQITIAGHPVMLGHLKLVPMYELSCGY